MNKYKLLNAIESAIENGIRYKNGKWDKMVLTIVTEKNLYGISMTDPDEYQTEESQSGFPDGCILVVAGNADCDLNNINWGETGMIGKWIDYNYGSTDEMADYIYDTIEEEEGDYYWYVNAEFVKED